MTRIRLKIDEFQALRFDGTQAEYIIDLEGIKHVVVSTDIMCQVDIGDWIIFMDGEPHAVLTDESLRKYYEILEEGLEGPQGSLSPSGAHRKD